MLPPFLFSLIQKPSLRKLGIVKKKKDFCL